VYNVPLGGALLTAEVMMGSISLPIVLPALACSGIATATAWLYLPSRATYLDVPGYHVTAPLLAWALLAGPLIGVIAAGYIRLIGWVSHHQASGRRALIAPVGACGVLALIGFAYPAALRQREGHGARRLPGHRRPGSPAGPVRAQAAGHGAVPGQRRVRGLVHADGHGHRHRGRPAHRRVLDLLRAAAGPPVIRRPRPAGPACGSV
jgi:hypothetical protein